MPEHSCSSGWGERCASATSKQCACKCNGHNHGKFNQIKESMKEVIEAGNGGFKGKYGLQIIKGASKVAVIFTEFPDNKGTSVTNCIERLATEVLNTRLQGYPPSNIVWIEHYPEDLFTPTGGSYDQVSLDYDGKTLHNPSWRRVKGASFLSL